MLQRRTRIKPKGRPYRKVDVKRHLDRVAALGCIVCGAEAEIHHVTGFADRPGRLRRDDWMVVGLCPPHHRKGCDPFNRFPQSVEALGHQGFFQEHGIDLHAEAMRLADDTKRLAA